jgi:predicted ribosomally synthesized peptide with SipW-like signal peptide
MNSKLVKASLAGAAAIALAAGGSTFAAFSDFGDINSNSVGAGFLKLDLNAGHGSAPLDFDSLAPGMNSFRTIWVASNDGQSVPSANLAITFKNLQDTAAPCSTSLGKASVDAGCSVSNDGLNTITGTPTAGHLSQMLTFQTQYYPSITDPQTCQATLANSYPAYNSILAADHPGDMFESAGANGGAGTTYLLKQADGVTPLVLTPGQGVCIGIGAQWVQQAAHPTGAAHFTNPAYPVDNAAHGDSMKFDAHFDLTQV